MTLILRLERFEESNDATISRLLLPKHEGEPGNPKVYYAVEDQAQTGEKVPGETRIPAGRYKIKLRRDGGMVKKYDARFTDINHDGMLWLQDVPDFEFVYIHIGNTDDDSRGCILPGRARGANMSVIQSKNAYCELYKAVWREADTGWLEIDVIDPVK